jgi:uncharacterized membrane protein
MAVYSSIASGMIALTRIAFSLAFVMAQATAYSPRLVLWIARDPVMSHALGVFTATFLYAIAALAGVDLAQRSGIQKDVHPHTLRYYVPCLTMSCNRSLAQYFRPM